MLSHLNTVCMTKRGASIMILRYGRYYYEYYSNLRSFNFYLLIKRFIDLIGSLILLVLLFPIILFAAILIKLTSGGPVFHKRERMGLNQAPFEMWKFRTMVKDAHLQEKKLKETENMNGNFFKVKNDPRVTTFGRFLRKYSIDELPQLINVLRGDMSLVGPRPLFEFELSCDINEMVKSMRFSMKPGLTCIWQVNGRSNTSEEERLKFDLDYVNKCSLLLDIKLMFKTIPVVLRGEGAV